MTEAKTKREGRDRDGRSRPEDPATHRRERRKRLLRNDMLPDAAAMIVQSEDAKRDSETEAALKRATAERNRDEPA
jgi:hypothetical protein